MKENIKVDDSDYEYLEDGYFHTESGYKLKILPIKLSIVRTFTASIGVDLFKDADLIDSLPAHEQSIALAGWENLTHYCLGRGVEAIEIPRDSQHELDALGFWSDNAITNQSYYLQVEVLEDETEIGNLVGAIIWYSAQLDKQKQEKAQARQNQPTRKKKSKK